jgi:predicted Zn-dependent protease
LNRRHFEGAVTQLNRAIQYNPQIEQAYYLLARAYAGLGQMDNAAATVKRYGEVRAANRHSFADKRPGQLGVEDRKRSQ